MSEDSTTPDPVELARSFLAAVNRRDVDAVESFYAPDAVLRSAEIGTLVGPAAIRSFFEDILSRYDEFHGELEEIIDLGNGVGFLVTVCRGRPVGGEEEVRLRLASVLLGTESVIQGQTNYLDIDEARAAAERLAASRE